jgi:site-specific DNA-cytosine methylase
MVNKCDKCDCSWHINFEDPKTNNICPNCGNIDIKSTRSGLLGQVQRLLTVSHAEGTLPKYLLLENVKNLVGSKFKPQFDAWVNWLDLIGYNTHWKIINGKHMGIPQNRERVFAISIRKDVDTNGFTFPEQIPLETRLKDILEHNVDEKYYLPDDRIEKILNSSFMQEKKRIQMTDVCDTLLARDWKDPKCVPVEDLEPIRLGGLYDSEGGRHQAGAIWDKDAISPTLDTMQGGNRQPFIVTEEPFIVASRGRNPENPSDRTVGAPTEQRLEPNFSGCSNTLTSVQKDNYVAEPMIIQNPHGFNKGQVREDCPSITSSYFQENNYIAEPQTEKNLWTETQKKMITEDGNVKRYINSDVVDEFNVGDCADISFPNGYNKANRVFDGYSPAINGTTTQSSFIVKEPIVYDDYNSRISANQDAINTLTCNCGASAERNGVKIIEPVIVEDFYQSREPRVYSETAPTIRSERTGLKAADGEFEEVVERIKWRIRKLTPCECLRLMNFTDSDYKAMAKYVSSSAIYKQAGNSIIVANLIALMSSLFIEDGHKAEVWTKYALHFND